VPLPPPVVVVPTPTTLIAVDTSVLRIQDDDPGIYFVALSTDLSWRGATLVRSVDNVAGWTALDSFSTLAAYGITTTALGDWPGYNLWDTGHTLDVSMASGTPLSLSREVVLSGGAQLGLLGNELLYWSTATQLSQTTWRLSDFLRGRRGTEWACTGHSVQELFIVLDEFSVRRYSAPASDIQQVRYYRAVSQGQAIEDAGTLVVTNTGRGQRCFSPQHLHGTRDTSQNLTITWSPRTRLPWDSLDGIRGPSGEPQERYRVTILAALGSATVLRTWDVTMPSATYSATDQTTDGITPGNLVAVSIVQLNQFTGPGMAGDALL
jgi:hypothetical protein